MTTSVVQSPIGSIVGVVGPYTTTNSKGVTTNIHFSRPISNAYKSTTTPIPLLISQKKYHNQKQNNFSVLSQTNQSTATHTATNKAPTRGLLEASYNQ